jgi:HEAT repeat protein
MDLACCDVFESASEAIETLQRFGASAASAAARLADALPLADSRLRLELLQALVAIGTNGGIQVPLVQKCLADENVDVQLTAANLLLKMNKEQNAAVLTLQSVLVSGTSQQRLEAARTMIQSGKESEAMPAALVWILQHDKSSENERFRAARLLNRLGDQAVIATPTLLKVIHDDPESRVRNEAFHVLLDLGESAMPWYVEELRKDRKGYGISAAFMIGKLQRASPLAIEELTRIACNRDIQTEVRNACVKALKELGPLAQTAAPRLTKVLSEYESQIADRARHPTSSEGMADAFAYFYEGTELPQQDLRFSAVEALGRMNDRSVIPELMVIAESTPKVASPFTWDMLRSVIQHASLTIQSTQFLSNFAWALSYCVIALSAALSCFALVASFTGGRRQNAAIRSSGVCLALGIAILPAALYAC